MHVRIWIDGIGPFPARYFQGAWRDRMIEARRIPFPFDQVAKVQKVFVEAEHETFTLSKLTASYERLNPLCDGLINFYVSGQR